MSEENRKLNSNWEKRYSFVNNNGKPVSCEVSSNIRSEIIFVHLTRHYSTKHEKTYGKYHGTSREAILKKLKGNHARNQRGATGKLPPLKRLCVEDVLPMFVFCERAFSIIK